MTRCRVNTHPCLFGVKSIARMAIECEFIYSFLDNLILNLVSKMCD